MQLIPWAILSRSLEPLLRSIDTRHRLPYTPASSIIIFLILKYHFANRGKHHALFSSCG
jgi:hypothetical protein